MIAGALIALSSQVAQCQMSYVSAGASSPIVASPDEPMPAYEVVTIKPSDGKGFGPPLSVYIKGAFGLSLNAAGLVIGPDWITSAKYVIQAKPPEAISAGMNAMSAEQKRRQTGLMKQSLLADRFKLKAHFETREMPVYQLAPGKGGPKLKEITSPIEGSRSFSVGASVIRGVAQPLHVLTDILEGLPDIGGRLVIDKAELTGLYDFTLKWAPMQAAGATAPTPEAEAASLFTAIEEQLGLKLVSTKAAVQVLVIDHIERPSEN